MPLLERIELELRADDAGRTRLTVRHETPQGLTRLEGPDAWRLYWQVFYPYREEAGASVTDSGQIAYSGTMEQIQLAYFTQLVRAGRDDTQIARQMGVSGRTVRNWRKAWREQGVHESDLTTAEPAEYTDRERRMALVVLDAGGLAWSEAERQTGISKATLMRWHKARMQERTVTRIKQDSYEREALRSTPTGTDG